MKKNVVLVIFGILVIIPVVVVFVILRSENPGKTKDDIYQHYSISKEFKKDEILNLVSKMSKDQEFKFYFYALDKEQINGVANLVEDFLSENSGRWEIHKMIEELGVRVRSSGALFYYMNIPSDFHERPDQYPQIEKVMRDFLLEEFQLAILGVCYKVTYDKNFKYFWDVTSIKSAEKLRSLVIQMKNVNLL